MIQHPELERLRKQRCRRGSESSRSTPPVTAPYALFSTQFIFIQRSKSSGSPPRRLACDFRVAPRRDGDRSDSYPSVQSRYLGPCDLRLLPPGPATDQAGRGRSLDHDCRRSSDAGPLPCRDCLHASRPPADSTEPDNTTGGQTLCTHTRERDTSGFPA